ncbi:Pol polyprotein [Elysia marginata]|uniref:Pol polyprotein n=1 Tax=Elysia marginata TaxID=1093978 RepID=A0AAV4GFV1_9GAST|nr:Pol polyprotein [Elysia marginata]
MVSEEVEKSSRKPHSYQHKINVNDLTQLDLNDVDPDNSEPENEEFFLNSLQGLGDEPWTTKCKINGKDEATFKTDTRADVTVISRKNYDNFIYKPALQTTKIHLNSPGGPIKCLGKFQALISTCEDKNAETAQAVYVFETKSENLLGRRAIQALGLLSINEISTFEEIKCTPVKIHLHPDAVPCKLSCLRRIPIPLYQKVEKELERMKELGVIEQISDPTDWCSPMVPVIKKNGDVCICTDLKNLNKYLKRERFMLPTAEDLIHKLTGSTIFSKLDLSSGFSQIPLDPDTAKLTTFITPCGRFSYKRLPFGISSVPEIFQRTMTDILKHGNNTLCYMDDILIHSKNSKEHEKNIEETLKKLKAAGVRLNDSKCLYRQKEIDFLGFKINKDGVKPSDEKVTAILALPEPTSITELRRTLGMVNYLGRYLPNLSNITHPMSELLEKDKAWVWGPRQSEALQEIKRIITQAPTLQFFNTDRKSVVSSDASSYGLGAVLMQEDETGNLQPVAYASRSLTSTERRYSQIEKECLGIVWACERFDKYLTGLSHFTAITDHKPLLPIVNKK